MFVTYCSQRNSWIQKQLFNIDENIFISVLRVVLDSYEIRLCNVTIKISIDTITTNVIKIKTKSFIKLVLNSFL